MAGHAVGSTVQSAVLSPEWRTGRIARNGRPSLFGYNAALHRAGDKAAYPILVEITMALLAPMWHDLIHEVDLPELAAMEEIVTDRASGRAALAGQFTAVGQRRIVVYTNDPEWAKDLTVTLEARITKHPLRVTARSDAQWNAYGLFGKLRRRARTNVLVAMLLVTLLEGVLLTILLGAAWGTGDAIATACSLALLLAPSLTSHPSRSAFQIDMRSQWLARHTGWAFAFYSLTVAPLFLVLPALFLRHVLTSWECAVVALALGGAMTLAVWPTERKYYAGVRARTERPS